MATRADAEIAASISNATEEIEEVLKRFNEADECVRKFVEVLKNAEKCIGNQRLTGNIKDFKDAVARSCQKGDTLLAISKDSMRPKVESVAKLLKQILEQKQVTSEHIKQEIDRVDEIREVTNDFCRALDEFQISLGRVEDPTETVAADQKANITEVVESRSLNRTVGGTVTGILGVAAVIIGGPAVLAATGVALPATVAAVAASEVATAAGIASGVTTAISAIFTCGRETNFNKKIQQIHSIIQSLDEVSTELKESAKKISGVVKLTVQAVDRLRKVLQALESIRVDKKTIEDQKKIMEEQKRIMEEQMAYIKRLEALNLQREKPESLAD